MMELVSEIIEDAVKQARQAGAQATRGWAATGAPPIDMGLGTPDGETFFAQAWATWVRNRPLNHLLAEDQDRVLNAFRVTFFKSITFAIADEMSRRRLLS